MAESAEINQLAADEETEAVIGWRTMFGNRWLRRTGLVGIGIAMFQKLTGMKTIVH